jgi:amidophosphoribosyltransferase
MLTQNILIGVRDPYGIRPLVIGKIKNSYVFASETCALDIIGAKYIRDVENGEIVFVENDKLNSIKPFPQKKIRPCVFEYIYFSRPDSILNNKCAYEYRKNFGLELAKEAHVESDLVIPVPDSGVPAAIGYSQYTKKNFELGLIRNHYVGRTFIEPTQQIRSFGVKLKHNINKSIVKNKSLILIDDSLVRGTTSVKIIKMLYDAGAKEVHLKIASPPIRYPDYYGVDTPNQNELLASKLDIEGMRKFINATTLQFLSIEGLYKSMGYEKRNSSYPQFTDHCFTGEYPVKPIDANDKDFINDQPSLMSSKY